MWHQSQQRWHETEAGALRSRILLALCRCKCKGGANTGGVATHWYRYRSMEGQAAASRDCQHAARDQSLSLSKTCAQRGAQCERRRWATGTRCPMPTLPRHHAVDQLLERRQLPFVYEVELLRRCRAVRSSGVGSSRPTEVQALLPAQSQPQPTAGPAEAPRQHLQNKLTRKTGSPSVLHPNAARGRAAGVDPRQRAGSCSGPGPGTSSQGPPGAVQPCSREHRAEIAEKDMAIPLEV